MQTYQNFIGIDVSKAHLDVALIQNAKRVSHTQIKNNIKAISAYLEELKEQIDLSETLFCLESTGHYINFLVTTLVSFDCSIWVENALQIKKSMGATREKNDEIDSERIGLYAFRFQDQVRLYSPVNENIAVLKTLQTLRKKHVVHKQELETYAKETKAFSKKAINEVIDQHTQTLLEHLTLQIETIEKQMLEIIQNDKELKEIYQLTTSVTGVGKVTAIHLIVMTEGFTKFDTAKQLACYAGVVPFERSSGSFKGKARVSNRANKTLKTALHMCALSASRAKGELNDYFIRKVADGKNKMSVINTIRNKIIQRVFACVKNKIPYDKNGINFNNFSKG